MPIADLYLLLRTGTPKMAWVNPDGGHTGRSKEWTQERIDSEVVVPWLVATLRTAGGDTLTCSTQGVGFQPSAASERSTSGSKVKSNAAAIGRSLSRGRLMMSA